MDMSIKIHLIDYNLWLPPPSGFKRYDRKNSAQLHIGQRRIMI